jgi:hypothetical protein
LADQIAPLGSYKGLLA